MQCTETQPQNRILCKFSKNFSTAGQPKTSSMSFSSHFLFFRFGWQKLRKTEISHNNLFLFFIIFHFRLACLALQTKNIVQKSRKLFSFLVTLSTKTKNRKWDEKLTNLKLFFIQIDHHGTYTQWLCSTVPSIGKTLTALLSSLSSKNLLWRQWDGGKDSKIE